MMTPEEIEELRTLADRLNATEFENNLSIVFRAALEHIDQQAASLAATEERVREHEAHENQTHEVLGKILGTDDTLKNVAQRAVDRIAELEQDLEQEEHNSDAFMNEIGKRACQMVDLEIKISELMARIVTLQEIAITEKAYHIYYRCQGDCGRWVCSAGAHKKDARRQLAEEHPEIFGD